MTLWSRIRRLVEGRAHAALDRAEDPVQALEAAYRAQVAAHEDARRGVADVLTSEKRLEIEVRALEAAGDRVLVSAREALRLGDEHTARRGLERETFLSQQRERLLNEIADIRAQRVALEAMTEALGRRVEVLRTEKLALRARYATAKATVRAGENVTGISDDMADVARRIERARERSRDAQARAEALVELAGSSGSAATLTADTARVDSRLAALKAEKRVELTDG